MTKRGPEAGRVSVHAEPVLDLRLSASSPPGSTTSGVPVTCISAGGRVASARPTATAGPRSAWPGEQSPAGLSRRLSTGLAGAASTRYYDIAGLQAAHNLSVAGVRHADFHSTRHRLTVTHYDN